MTPREIDALVAEKVMGFVKSDLVFLGEPHVMNPLTNVHHQLPKYSSDIADAWEVVENLTTNYDAKGSGYTGLGIKIEYRTEGSENQACVTLVNTVCSPPYEEMSVACFVEAETLPLAICLAALRAKGVEIGENWLFSGKN